MLEISAAADAGALTSRPAVPGYRWYVLSLLVLVYAFNFIDRQIVAILAPFIKTDLALTDAQIGLLYGTAFALFYGLFGIPIARLADGWSRTRTLSLGLCFWSLMTMLSGTATSFVSLGLARIGVGIGEASGTPASLSLLGDYFPRRMRATVIAIYSSGIYIGIGFSLALGGSIVTAWDGLGGFHGWQVAFVAVGLPGVLLATLVATTVREPVRGGIDGAPAPADPHPVASMLGEASTLFPPWSLFRLWRGGASRAAVTANAAVLGGAVFFVAVVTWATDQLLSANRRAPIAAIGGLTITTNLVQWMVAAIGGYAAFSWIQASKLRDPEAHIAIVGSPVFVALALCCGFFAMFLYALGAFVFLYASRNLGFVASDGVTIGVITALAGSGGLIFGGMLGDRLKQRHPAGRIYLMLGALILFTGATAVQYTTVDRTIFLGANFCAMGSLTMYTPLLMGTGQDLVPPRLRALAAAMQILASNIIGLGLGPYAVGFISDVTGDLRLAILLLLAASPLIAVLLIYAAKKMRVEAQG